MGELATSPLPYRGAPTPQSGGQNQKWATSGRIGYLTPTVLESPTASERGAKSEVAHKCGGDTRYGRGEVATLPTCGPLLILPPALKRWGSPKRQG